MNQNERVAKEIFKGKVEYRNGSRYFAALSGSEIAEILQREYGKALTALRNIRDLSRIGNICREDWMRDAASQAIKEIDDEPRSETKT